MGRRLAYRAEREALTDLDVFAFLELATLFVLRTAVFAAALAPVALFACDAFTVALVLEDRLLDVVRFRTDFLRVTCFW